MDLTHITDGALVKRYEDQRTLLGQTRDREDRRSIDRTLQALSVERTKRHPLATAPLRP
jgi:hypothetical protein